MDLSKFFVKAPLIPVICQDSANGEVLMLGYADEEALRRTMQTGTAWFFSVLARNCGIREKHRAILSMSSAFYPIATTIP